MGLLYSLSETTLFELYLIREEEPALWEILLISGLEYLTPPLPQVFSIPGEFPCFFPEVEQGTFGQSIDAGAAMELFQHDELAGRVKLLAIYFQPALDKGKYNSDRVENAEMKIRNARALDVYAVSNYLINEMVKVQTEMNANIKNIPYTKEEKDAGAQELEKFGVLSLVYSLAKGDALKIKDWMAESWAFVNGIILLENKKANFQHKLNKLLNPKKQ